MFLCYFSAYAWRKAAWIVYVQENVCIINEPALPIISLLTGALSIHGMDVKKRRAAESAGVIPVITPLHTAAPEWRRACVRHGCRVHTRAGTCSKVISGAAQQLQGHEGFIYAQRIPS